METTDDEEQNVTYYPMSTTDDEENDVTNYPIETTKPSPSAAAPIETNIQSTIELPLKQGQL